MADFTTETGCRVRVVPAPGGREGAILALTMVGEMPARHAEVLLTEAEKGILRRNLRDEERHPKLGYRRPTVCCGHEIAPDAEPAEAEMIVAGYAFCYPCGNFALGATLDGHTPVEILREIRDGVYTVAP